ncbi:hypothetical protein ACVWZL_002049 [Bradyrhizobium sp. GM2.4]
MTDRSDLSNLPSYRQPRRPVFSARKIALMASVVAGLGAAVYGFGTSTSPADLFSTPALAQVNNEVRKVERPIGFADIVERVKPSVISVKVNMKERRPRATTTAMIPPRRSSRARRWSGSSAASAVRMASRA